MRDEGRPGLSGPSSRCHDCDVASPLSPWSGDERTDSTSANTDHVKVKEFSWCLPMRWSPHLSFQLPSLVPETLLPTGFPRLAPRDARDCPHLRREGSKGPRSSQFDNSATPDGLMRLSELFTRRIFWTGLLSWNLSRSQLNQGESTCNASFRGYINCRRLEIVMPHFC